MRSGEAPTGIKVSQQACYLLRLAKSMPGHAMFLSTVLALGIFFMFPPVSARGSEGFRSLLLENGLRLIMKEDHSTNLVASVVSIRGGSAGETSKTNGLAHLLEHMLFDGTKTRSRQEIQSAFKHLGGYANAFTRKDFTAYEIVMPSDTIYQGMVVQSDMLLNSTFPEMELIKEKKVVIEEIKQDSIYSSSLFERVYYRGTPYARKTIGSEEIVNSVEQEELLDYYRRFYVPNNMSVIVIGAFKPDRMIKEVAKIFGTVPGGEDIVNAEKILPDRKWPFSEEMTIPFGQATLNIGFSAPAPDDPDSPVFPILAEILSGDPGDTLSLPDNIYATYEVYRKLGDLLISIPLKNPDQGRQALDMIKKVIGGIISQGISEERLKQAKLSIRTAEVFDNEKFLHEAREVARWDSLGDFRLRERLSNNIERLTSDDIRRVTGVWFSEWRPYTVLFRPPPPEKKRTDISKKTVQIKRVLESGLTILARQDPFSRIAAIHLLVKGRAVFEAEGKEGIANLAAIMLLEEAENSPGIKPSDIAARIKVTDNPYMPFDNYYFSRDYSTIRVEVLNDFLQQGVELSAGIIVNPKFSPPSLEKAKELSLQRIAREKASTAQVAGNLLYRTLFKNHPFRHSILGTRKSIDDITLDDVRTYAGKAFTAGNMILSVVSSHPVAEVMISIESSFAKLRSASRGKIKATFPTDIPQSPQTATEWVDKDQGWLLWGNTFPPLSSQEFPVAYVMNRLIGNRLRERLREKEGLAYRVGSSLRITSQGGIYTASIGTQHMEKARKGLLSILKRFMKEKISSRELELAVKGCLNRHLQYHQRRINQGYYLGFYEYLGYGYEFDENLKGLLEKVTAEQVKKLAKEIINLKGYVLVMAGRIKG